jgi:rRNA methylases
VVGLEGTAEAKVRDFPLVNDPLVLVTGAEGSGLSRLVKQTCDLLIGIDAPGMESLNAAVATGIALYEISARRGE